MKYPSTPNGRLLAKIKFTAVIDHDSCVWLLTPAGQTLTFSPVPRVQPGECAGIHGSRQDSPLTFHTLEAMLTMIDWVKFIIPSARFWLYEMPMLWTWDMLVAPPPESHEG